LIINLLSCIENLKKLPGRFEWRNFNALIFVVSIFINLLGLAFPIFILQVYDRIVPNVSYGSLWVLFFFVMLAILFELTLKILRTFLVVWEDSRMQYQKQSELMNQLLHAPVSLVEKKGVGYYLERLRNFVVIHEAKSPQRMTDYADFPFLFILVGVIGYLGEWLILVPILIFGALAYLYFRNSEQARPIYKQAQQNSDRRGNYFVEMLSGIHTIKALNIESLMLRRYERLHSKTTEINYDLRRNQGNFQSYSMLAVQLNTIFIVALGAILVIHGSMTLGGLSACVLLSTRAFQPITKILERVCTENKKAELSNVTSLSELSSAQAQNQEKKKTRHSCFVTAGKIEFKNMSFSYGSKKVFENLNFIIRGGETISLSGLTFSGKTTFLGLLSGLLTPSFGRILIDDQDISDFSLDELEKSIAFLSEETHLFSGTILENLSMFNSDKILKAKGLAQDLGLDKTILKLPQGYQTAVGSSAVELLAPGVRQMIAIVRGLVNKDLKILLFDEANLSLDMPADLKLIDFLKRLQKHCTLVLVSHRPSVIKLADHHYQLSEGGIHEKVL
jgi:ATP-binding cassette subfamily C protein LapB